MPAPLLGTDARRLCLAAFLRALATGLTGIHLGLFLGHLRLAPVQAGLVVAAGLLGAASASLLATLRGDRVGRRRFLVGLSVLGALGAAAAAFAGDVLSLGVFAFLGMLNGMGRDRGAALVLEQAALPATVADDRRTAVLAAYNVAQDAGHALGSLLAVLPALAMRAGLSEPAALRSGFGLVALLSLAPLPLYLRLSPSADAPRVSGRPALSPESRRRLARLSGLFAVDSLAGGFLTAAFLTLFFRERFGAGPEALAPLFFAARVLNALSHAGAALLARRFGLVNAMVFTHAPSSLLLVSVAFAPSFPVAAVLFLLREGLVEMDVPTRQSYVLAVVRPEERTFASGLTHLVRLAGWAVAPAAAGLLAQAGSVLAPLLAGAGMKLGYDALLYAACRNAPPPEEAATRPPARRSGARPPGGR